jgi:hypothetical protein
VIVPRTGRARASHLRVPAGRRRERLARARGERLPGGETVTPTYILEDVIPVVLGRTLSDRMK